MKKEETYCVRCQNKLSIEYSHLIREIDLRKPSNIYEFSIRYCPMVACELYKVHQDGLEKIELQLKKDNWIIK